MEIQELEPHEQTVLIGLVKLIVHADQVVSPEERATLAALQQALGAHSWNARVKEAAALYPTVADLEVAARHVTRPVAQHLIHKVLHELADSDELIDAEAHVLHWIDQEWALHAGDDPETFVLLGDEEG